MTSQIEELQIMGTLRDILQCWEIHYNVEREIHYNVER